MELYIVQQLFASWLCAVTSIPVSPVVTPQVPIALTPPVSPVVTPPVFKWECYSNPLQTVPICRLTPQQTPLLAVGSLNIANRGKRYANHAECLKQCCSIPQVLVWQCFSNGQQTVPICRNVPVNTTQMLAPNVTAQIRNVGKRYPNHLECIKQCTVIPKVLVWECFANAQKTVPFCRYILKSTAITGSTSLTIPEFGKRYPTFSDCSEQCTVLPKVLVWECFANTQKTVSFCRNVPKLTAITRSTSLTIPEFGKRYPTFPDCSKQCTVLPKVFIWECFANAPLTVPFCRYVPTTTTVPQITIGNIPAFGQRYSALPACFRQCILAKPAASTPKVAPNLKIWECLPNDPQISQLGVICRYVFNSLAVPQRSSVSIPVIGKIYLTPAECSLKCAIPCRERQFQRSCSVNRNSAKTVGIKRRLCRGASCQALGLSSNAGKAKNNAIKKKKLLAAKKSVNAQKKTAGGLKKSAIFKKKKLAGATKKTAGALKKGAGLPKGVVGAAKKAVIVKKKKRPLVTPKRPLIIPKKPPSFPKTPLNRPKRPLSTPKKSLSAPKRPLSKPKMPLIPKRTKAVGASKTSVGTKRRTVIAKKGAIPRKKPVRKAKIASPFRKIRKNG